jgi:hypothetical protein
VEQDFESEVTLHHIRLTHGLSKSVPLPEDADGINGICRFRNLLLITTTCGRLFSWDGESDTVDEIKLP